MTLSLRFKGKCKLKGTSKGNGSVIRVWEAKSEVVMRGLISSGGRGDEEVDGRGGGGLK